MKLYTFIALIDNPLDDSPMVEIAQILADNIEDARELAHFHPEAYTEVGVQELDEKAFIKTEKAYLIANNDNLKEY